MASQDSFGAKATLDVDGTEYEIFRLDAVTGDPLPWDRDGDVHLPPYAALWLTSPSAAP